MLDLLAVCQRIPPYYSVLVTCLKLISNVLSVYQRTCCIFHTSAYVGAIRRSVTRPLVKNRKRVIGFFDAHKFLTKRSFNKTNNYHNHTLQTDPQFCEEKPPNTISHKTSGLGAKLIYMGYFASLLHPPGRKTWLPFSVRDMSWGLRNPCFTKFSVVSFL